MEATHEHEHNKASSSVTAQVAPEAGCCAAAKPEDALHAHHAHSGDAPARIATAATLHCLAGCAIGEIAGLMIGVALGIGVWPTMLLATVLAYASGFTLGLLPLVRRGMGFVQALRTIWLGEAISIAVMEIAMNFTDYHMGGMGVGSILHPRFWLGFLVALPAGFIAAWPVNWWLLKRKIKAPCH